MLDEAETKTVKQTASDRLDATTKAAQEIIDRETANREAKTARLKVARQAKEAAEQKTSG